MISLLEAMGRSRTTHGSFPNHARRIPKLRIASREFGGRCSMRLAQTLHRTSSADAALPTSRSHLYTISASQHSHTTSWHMTTLRHTTLSLTHSNQTTPNQLLQQPKPTRLLGSLSAYMHPADPLYMLSAHVKLTSSHPYVLCSYVVCRFRFQFLARVLLRFLSFRSVNSLFRRVSSCKSPSSS